MPRPKRAPRHAAAQPARALTPDMNIDNAMAAVFADAQAQWLEKVGLSSTGNPEGVHQLRVGLRRLRSALSLLKDYIPSKQHEAITQSLKWLIDAFAPVRDLDVFMNELLSPLQEHGKAIKHFDLLTQSAIQARSIAQQQAHAALVSTRHRRLVQHVSTWISTHEWRNGKIPKKKLTASASEVARTLLNQRVRKIRKQGRHIEKLPPEDLHDLRISIKKVRYGVSFFKAVLPKRARKLGKILAQLQETLGKLNDAAVAEEIIARLAKTAPSVDERKKIAKAGKQVVAYHKKTAADVRPDIAPRWKALKKFGSL